MKISNILIALIILFSVACTSKNVKNEHGHEHETEDSVHSHDDDGNHVDQEEFTIEDKSIQEENDSTHHIHEDGSEHHDH